MTASAVAVTSVPAAPGASQPWRESAGSARTPRSLPADSGENRRIHDGGGRRASVSGLAALLRRGAVGLAALGVLAHAALLAAGGHAPVVAVVLALMTLGCARCAATAWRSPGPQALGTVIGMSLAMAVAYVVLALGPVHLAHHGAAGGVSGTPAAVALPGSAAMLAVAALDVVIAWVAALALRVSR
ncbi:hypothetical protein [Tersicoccus sp. Bi-70]|uniref:hypothetical protein n=1 Tax=Tersicoccus sp. Bi-70 TaxID=1897634 RepID=UPI000979E0E6|nr:hypothetical protein [Tersicoccus sp. Bi-70]OMH34101.1 hypothetical protein BGP79_02740 [Tersicoccus sp. Bi-70]